MREFLLEGDSRLLFSEPGVGKSRPVIETSDYLASGLDITGTLVIAPKRVALLTWPNELEKWSQFGCANLATEAGMAAWRKGSAAWYLINIDRLQQFVEQCLKGKKAIPVSQIVWDECHIIRNPTGKRIKKFMPHRGLFSRHVGMTGTPTPNSPLDLFSQARTLDGGEALGKVWTAFRSQYATSDYMGYTWSLNPGAKEDIYRKISHMTLAMKASEWMDIPPVQIIDIDVALPDDARADYKTLEKEYILELLDGEVVAQTAGVLVGKLRQMTGGAVYHGGEEGTPREVAEIHTAKIEALQKLHDKMEREPLLVFLHYDHERDRIKKAIPYARDFREEDLGKWNAGEISMWLAHPKSAGVGLNLQGPCATVCWFSGTYSSADFSQGNARVARTGQTKPTSIYRLMCPDTIDEAMVETVRRKLDGQNGALETLKNMATLTGLAR